MNRSTRLLVLALLMSFCATGTNAQDIERVGEGRYFYNTIFIPAGAETLYLSGSGG